MKADKARDYVVFGLLLWLLYRRQGTQTTVTLTDANGNPISSVPADNSSGMPAGLPQSNYDTIHFIDEWGNLVYWDGFQNAYISLPPRGTATDGRTLYFDGINYWACDAASKQCQNVGPTIAI